MPHEKLHTFIFYSYKHKTFVTLMTILALEVNNRKLHSDVENI